MAAKNQKEDLKGQFANLIAPVVMLVGLSWLLNSKDSNNDDLEQAYNKGYENGARACGLFLFLSLLFGSFVLINVMIAFHS